MEEEHEYLIPKIITITCPHCQKEVQIPILPSEQERIELLHEKLTELIKQKEKIEKEINLVDKTLKKCINRMNK